mgnify:FL=1
MFRIGYLGPKGTFSQEALEEYVGNKIHTALDFGTISDMLHAVEAGSIDEAVVPIENSIEGAVNATMDMLAFDVDLKIKAELLIPVNQHLLVKKGTQIENIRYIISHPQPFGQCRNFIDTHFPKAVLKYSYSTAEAASEVAGGEGDCAAIASISAAKVYGLDVAARNIQDTDNNSTRFVVLSKESGKRSGFDKTSLVFSTEDRPGSLYRILDIFNLWDINMTRIESRPAKSRLGNYIFFVDIEGHIEDEDVRDAITMVKRKTSFFKFLGSYPRYRK